MCGHIHLSSHRHELLGSSAARADGRCLTQGCIFQSWLGRVGGDLQVETTGCRARRAAVFPLFRLGCELCWDTTGSASPFELSHWCQDLQALAVGQRRPPSLTGLGKPRESDTLKTPFHQLLPPLRKSTHHTGIPTSRGQMLSCLSRGFHPSSGWL